MNQEEKSKNEKTKSADIAETDDFDKAIASRNAIIESRNMTIKELKKKVGNREETISGLMEKLDASEARRIEAESKVAEGKELNSGVKRVMKTEEEKFTDSFLENWEKGN